jgi:hypothetical protein
MMMIFKLNRKTATGRVTKWYNCNCPVMRLVRHVVRMGWIKIAQKLLLGKLQTSEHLEDLGVDR